MSENSVSEAEYDAITDAAAHWCMRLHAADCADAERDAFQRWHDAHPLHALNTRPCWRFGTLPSTCPALPPSLS